MSLEINTIHNQFYIILGRYIKAHINDTDDASDVLQEVFIKINENLGSLTDEGKLKAGFSRSQEIPLLTIIEKIPIIKNQS